MIRVNVLKKNFYNKEFELVEDYEFWTCFVFLGKMVNLDDVLLYYRIYFG